MSAPAKKKGGKRCSPRASVLPTITAVSTGPQSRWSAAREQYLDGSQAGKIEPQPRQDRTSGKSNAVKPHFETMLGTAQRAAPLQSDAPPPLSTANPLKAGPTLRPQAVVGGRAGRARKSPPILGLLCAYTPISWHHEKGIIKVVRRLLPRLPDVSGMLFKTYTLDHNLFSGPASAFEIARKKIRKLYARLRKGILWKGKHYKIDARYCVKVEFHADEDGWPHFHIIQLTRRFIPGDLLNHLWGLGRVNVERINNDEFRYLLKYTTKGIGYPAWVLSRNRIRIFQSSRGFLKPREARKKTEAEKALPKPKRKRASDTIGARIDRWARTALLNENDCYRTLMLLRPFQQLFDELVHSIAEDDRYLGLGLIKLNHIRELLPWELM
jgi:hypothetical protein